MTPPVLRQQAARVPCAGQRRVQRQRATQVAFGRVGPPHDPQRFAEVGVEARGLRADDHAPLEQVRGLTGAAALIRQDTEALQRRDGVRPPAHDLAVEDLRLRQPPLQMQGLRRVERSACLRASLAAIPASVATSGPGPIR